MKLKKKICSAFTAMIMSTTFLIPSIVSAENPKAEELRNIIKSNNYYVEYEINKKEDKRALAVNGVKKKSFDCDGRRSATALSFIPIVGLFAKGSLKLSPEVYYDSQNYYQFVTKKKLLRASEEEMNDPYINPAQEWSTVKQRIVLPEEFGMFTGDNDISFVESGEKIIDTKGTKVNFDKYFKILKNTKGVNIAKKVYFVYYNVKGDIDKILTLTVDFNEDAGQIFAADEDKKPEQQIYNIQRIKVNKFTGELPADIMKFPEGAKVYGPGTGDMNEVLEQPPLLEEHWFEVNFYEFFQQDF